MALSVKCCLVLAVLKLAHAFPGLRGVAGPSIVKPLPAMIWDKGPLPGETISGWLTAPMNPFDLEGPNVSLRVRCTFASVQPAPLGTLLLHCGGPGSGTNCVDLMATSDLELRKSYNIFAVDQRGLRESLPKISCNATEEAFHLPMLGKNGTYEIQDFTSCPCSEFDVIDDDTSRFMHHIPFGEGEESALLQYYQSMYRQKLRCYLSQEGKHGKYNIFEYIGTEYLAHDLESFRKAIGAEKLHLWGGSYGTQVCSVYASMFPQHTGKMIIDSNVNPMPTVKEYVEDYADNDEQMFAEMARLCHAMGRSCPLKNPLEDFDAVLAKLSSGFFSAPTDLGTMKLTPVYLTKQMQPKLQSPLEKNGKPMWFEFAKLIGDMLSSEDGRNFTETLLDKKCKLKIAAGEAASCKDKVGKSLAQENPDSNTTVFCPTWRQYGVCVTNNNGSDIATNVGGAIWSQDTPGRYLPGQYAKYHAYVLSKFGPVGAAPAQTMASNAFWPARISYPGVGNAELRPLIFGVTKDPQTPFLWTQRMVQAFPNSRVMTWQGYKHVGMEPLFVHANSSMRGTKPSCLMTAKQYLMTGRLPENGRVCHQSHLDLVGMD